MPKYTGSCHCGAVKFNFVATDIVDGLRCNCSVCQKKGAVMTNFFVAPEQIIIEAEEGALATYQFGTHIAKHHFCTRCGIYPFHKSLRKPGHYRINLACVDGIDSLALPTVMADGASL